jgi:heme o synthase
LFFGEVSLPAKNRNSFASYLSLLKLRSAGLNALSGVTGIVLAVGRNINLEHSVLLVLSGGLAAVGCGAINAYFDRDIDRVMSRTSARALPSGEINPPERAAWFGLALIAAGLVLSLLWLNWRPSLFILLGAVIYVLVYTMWLKRRTPWSVVVGGLAGCCALLAGWFSATDGFAPSVLVFSAFVFLWTPGHFWGLAVRTMTDSKRAGVPTLPVVYGEVVAARWAASSNVILVLFSALPFTLGMLDGVYFMIVLVTGLAMLVLNLRLLITPTVERAWAVFQWSNPYLILIYVAVMVAVLVK